MLVGCLQGLSALLKSVSSLLDDGHEAIETLSQPPISMSYTAQEIRELCPQFRVLVIGRRNAGKTTILKKMSGSDGSDVEIRDVNGNKVDPSVLESNNKRGMSEIENEITFKSNPLFVFHDSRGIEAGADNEENSPLRFNYLQNFIDMRSKKPRSEISYMPYVPVIAVFTKFEALVDQAYDELAADDASDPDEEEQAYQKAQSNFKEKVLEVVQSTKHPPKDFVQLQNLNEGTSECMALTKKTHAAMQDETLSDLFGLAQQNSFEVGCKTAFQNIMRRHLSWMEQIMRNHNKSVKNLLEEVLQFLPRWKLGCACLPPHCPSAVH
ncbi:hypothetical protein B0H10DRAFT_2206114 [Mycena sp. CBHHK59/15]|nr:hypothetical protein B0H10DRAFT_2206114 [Mycena sp. CBHHK59/15]